jgi:hypothetical protein
MLENGSTTLAAMAHVLIQQVKLPTTLSSNQARLGLPPKAAPAKGRPKARARR